MRHAINFNIRICDDIVAREIDDFWFKLNDRRICANAFCVSYNTMKEENKNKNLLWFFFFFIASLSGSTGISQSNR